MLFSCPSQSTTTTSSPEEIKQFYTAHDNRELDIVEVKASSNTILSLVNVADFDTGLSDIIEGQVDLLKSKIGPICMPELAKIKPPLPCAEELNQAFFDAYHKRETALVELQKSQVELDARIAKVQASNPLISDELVNMVKLQSDLVMGKIGPICFPTVGGFTPPLPCENDF